MTSDGDTSVRGVGYEPGHLLVQSKEVSSSSKQFERYCVL